MPSAEPPKKMILKCKDCILQQLANLEAVECLNRSRFSSSSTSTSPDLWRQTVLRFPPAWQLSQPPITEFSWRSSARSPWTIPLPTPMPGSLFMWGHRGHAIARPGASEGRVRGEQDGQSAPSFPRLAVYMMGTEAYTNMSILNFEIVGRDADRN